MAQRSHNQRHHLFRESIVLWRRLQKGFQSSQGSLQKLDAVGRSAENDEPLQFAVSQSEQRSEHCGAVLQEVILIFRVVLQCVTIITGCRLPIHEVHLR